MCHHVFFYITGGEEHPLLVIYINWKNKKKESFYRPTQDTKKEGKKIKPSKQINQSCLSIQLNTLYVLASHDAKAM